VCKSVSLDPFDVNLNVKCNLSIKGCIVGILPRIEQIVGFFTFASGGGVIEQV
jgi:hypothetical protein